MKSIKIGKGVLLGGGHKEERGARLMERSGVI
jgi:hypothetical protein